MREQTKRPQLHTLTSLIGLGVAALAICYLHIALNDDVNPIRQTVSDYVGYGFGAPLLGACALAFALAALAIIGGLESAGSQDFRVVSLLLGCGVLGLFGMALFPTDLVGSASSAGGELHRWSVALSFVSLPSSGRALAHRICDPARRRLLRFSTASTTALALLLVSYVPVVFPSVGGPIVIGLTERLLIGFDVVLVAAMACSLPPPSPGVYPLAPDQR